MKAPPSWLFPAPQSTPGGFAAYWPDTSFLDLPPVPLSPDELAALDPDAPAAPESMENYLAIAEHEHTHWIQAHAYSYGRFQSRLDQARTDIAETFFRLFDGDIRALLPAPDAGSPLLTLDAEQRVVPRSDLGAVASRLQRHWWGLGLLRHEWERGPGAPLQSSRFRFGLTTMYSRLGPSVSDVALLPDPDLLAQALDWSPNEELEQSIERSGFPMLHTAGIAECSAVLNQHWFYAYEAEWCRRRGCDSEAGRWRDRLISSWESKELTFYGDAFRVFEAFNPGVDMNASGPLATLALLCALSMDGPFPSETGVPVHDWRDVYPPLRFVALAEAASRVGLLPEPTLYAMEPKRLDGYATDLCDAASIASPQPYSASLPAAERWSGSPSQPLRRLHQNASAASTLLLAELPAAILASSEAAVFLAESLQACSIPDKDLARQAPLLVLGGKIGSAILDDERLWDCAVSGIYQRLMLYLFSGTSTTPTAGRPSGEFGQAAAEQAYRDAETRLGAEIPRPPV